MSLTSVSFTNAVNKCLIMEPEIVLASLSIQQHQQMGQNPANNWYHAIDLCPPTAPSPGKNAPNMAQTPLGQLYIDSLIF